MVTLEEMLNAREIRQERIVAALHHAPLVSFSMNIPGPVKDSPLIRRGFREGCRRLEAALADHSLQLLDLVECETGCEALFSAAGNALAIKQVCSEIEDSDQLGRLFDMDVIGSDGRKLDRIELGRSQRGCMVCGAEGRGCAARRLHSVEDLQRETKRRLREHFFLHDCQSIAALATQSLIDEVNTTPKPGLVDRANNGSHSDMDLALFEKSAAALTPYWRECFRIGVDTADHSPQETFFRLRREGLAAEAIMLAATDGVNTHKGAIFLMGILCGAAGRLWDAALPCRDPDTLCRECSRMTAAPLQEELGQIAAQNHADTAGAHLYLLHGLRGARGEAMDGLPGIRETALPALKQALSQGHSAQHSAAISLLHLISRGTDTNMVKRGGPDGAAWGALAAKKLLETDAFPSNEQIAALDLAFIQRNLSPGGCADLLAATLFLARWEVG